RRRRVDGQDDGVGAQDFRGESVLRGVLVRLPRAGQQFRGGLTRTVDEDGGGAGERATGVGEWLVGDGERGGDIRRGLAHGGPKRGQSLRVVGEAALKL